MYIVTFKDSKDKLVSMFNDHFNSIKEAKKAIEDDAKSFALFHRDNKKQTPLIYLEKKIKWIDPSNYDYCEVIGEDGSSCVYQYFKV